MTHILEGSSSESNTESEGSLFTPSKDFKFGKIWKTLQEGKMKEDVFTLLTFLIININKYSRQHNGT